MGHKLIVAAAHGADFSVNFIGELLFGFAPAKTVFKCFTEGYLFGRRSKGVIDYRKGGAIRILRLPGQPAVRDDACNGCGACESVCVSMQAAAITSGATHRAIVVEPYEE